jgi:hypothetical protein
LELAKSVEKKRKYKEVAYLKAVAMEDMGRVARCSNIAASVVGEVFRTDRAFQRGTPSQAGGRVLHSGQQFLNSLGSASVGKAVDERHPALNQSIQELCIGFLGRLQDTLILRKILEEVRVLLSIEFVSLRVFGEFEESFHHLAEKTEQLFSILRSQSPNSRWNSLPTVFDEVAELPQRFLNWIPLHRLIIIRDFNHFRGWKEEEEEEEFLGE